MAADRNPAIVAMSHIRRIAKCIAQAIQSRLTALQPRLASLCSRRALRKRLRTDGAAASAALAQGAEQRVEFGLHAGTHDQHHQRGHARQG